MSWDQELEKGLPDSRLSGAARGRKSVVYAHMLWERVFCANCGANGGLITAEWSPHVFYVCEECVAVAGEPPGMAEAPETKVRGIA